MKKDKLAEMAKNVGDLKDKAVKVGQGAAKAAGTVKDAVQAGVVTGKAVFEKAAQSINKDKIGQGLDAASKGVGMASKGMGKIADSLSKASEKLRKKNDSN